MLGLVFAQKNLSLMEYMGLHLSVFAVSTVFHLLVRSSLLLVTMSLVTLCWAVNAHGHGQSLVVFNRALYDIYPILYIQCEYIHLSIIDI